MTLHLIKLAVGCELGQGPAGLGARAQRQAKAQGLPRRHIHITRMTPKRVDELLDGGSLYWVIKGQIAARERLIGIEPFRDKAGVGRCRIVMEPKVVALTPRPMRAFQGWRYLNVKDAPPDLSKSGKGLVAMPEPMRRELRELGLL